MKGSQTDIDGYIQDINVNIYMYTVYIYMSAKHQENDTPVKASHLLLVIAVCQVLVPEHCLLGEPPKHEKFVSFHKSSVEWWPFVTYPAPQSRSTTV